MDTISIENDILSGYQNNELQIDINNEHSFRLFNNQMVILSRYIAVLHIQVRPSRNGLPGRHITVRLERAITPLERIALQAMLGSDRIRELLGFIRLKGE